jgi:hypothetical protein
VERFPVDEVKSFAGLWLNTKLTSARRAIAVREIPERGKY